MIPLWILLETTLPKECPKLMLESTANFIAYRKDECSCTVMEFEAQDRKDALEYLKTLNGGDRMIQVLRKARGR